MTDYMPNDWEYLVKRHYNRGSVGELTKEENFLNGMGQDGWIFSGQIARNWYLEGRWQVEYLDVFRRPRQEDS